MIRVAIVEDERSIQDNILKCVKSVIQEQGEVLAETFDTAEKFLERLKGEGEFQILILDIGLPRMQGIELGRLVREMYPHIYLIFLTSYSEYAADSYSIEAYQYILKEDMRTRLPDILGRLMRKIETEERQYRFIGSSSELQKLYYRDIVYICKEKSSKYVRYITLHGDYRERITLEQIAEELKYAGFIVIERGFLVNMRHIIGIKGEKIYLEDNHQIVISRARLPQVKQKIYEYWRDAR